MARPRVMVLRAPGTNCDEETCHAFRVVGAHPENVHLGALVEAPESLERFQILCIPGGFSYGDDLGAGRIFASKLTHRLGDLLQRFRDCERLIMGICNGFQVLLQTGLLIEPDPATGDRRATLAANAHGRFEDRWIHLELTAGPCAFVRQDERIELPIAHGEGNFIVSDSALIDELAAANRLTCRYVDEHGNPGGFPINPNGSMGDVAGLCDATGRVFALMPHPERHLVPHHHPRWTRRETQPPEGDGLRFFANAVGYFSR